MTPQRLVIVTSCSSGNPKILGFIHFILHTAELYNSESSAPGGSKLVFLKVFSFTCHLLGKISNPSPSFVGWKRFF